jgi:hypothetical protein
MGMELRLAWSSCVTHSSWSGVATYRPQHQWIEEN